MCIRDRYQGDPMFQDLQNKFSPNVGAGVYWHSDKAYVGLSVPNFIQTNKYSDNDIAIYKSKINYYLIAGYVFDLDHYQYIKFKPAILTKMVEGAPLQAVSYTHLRAHETRIGISCEVLWL